MFFHNTFHFSFEAMPFPGLGLRETKTKLIIVGGRVGCGASRKIWRQNVLNGSLRRERPVEVGRSRPAPWFGETARKGLKLSQPRFEMKLHWLSDFRLTRF